MKHNFAEVAGETSVCCRPETNCAGEARAPPSPAEATGHDAVEVVDLDVGIGHPDSAVERSVD